jgi:RNA polymerase sigma factor (sigma-70 family)
MSKFNPDFWETTIASASWGKFRLEDGLWYEHPDDAAERHERAERAEALLPAVREVMEKALSERQREIATLYFFEHLNQREIAERLGITQQSVSEHLYGKVRNGHAIGGALRKLRKACAKRGIRWE